MKSLRFPRFQTSLKEAGILLLAVLGIMTVFLLTTRWQGYSGFPLDDSWIHQTYARNLATRGEWSFIPGVKSAGSTSPLWSFLLAGGFLLGGDPPFGWTFLLGGASLFVIALFSQGIIHQLLPNHPISRFPWVGLLMVFEWHLVWAALSGMETILQGLMAVFVFWLMLAIAVANHAEPGKPEKKESGSLLYLVAGMAVGLAIWIRPDGITLLGPPGLLAILSGRNIRRKTIQILLVLAGAVLFVIPYLIFNWHLAGSVFPNTFFAKQAEYSIMVETPFWLRMLKLISLPMVGVGVLLVPGWLHAAWKMVNGVLTGVQSGTKAWIEPLAKEKIAVLGMGVWWLGYTLIYAIRLPVTYQHGRYLMPAMPVFFLIGVYGLLKMAQEIRVPAAWIQRLRFAYIILVGLITMGFCVLGANSYARDVGVIQTEMVASAQWIAAETPPDAIIAAHDIGALGYYGNRRILDLAGLISPEVVPFIRDEIQLSDYLDQQGADYLVVFPDWYATLPSGKPVVYQTGGAVSTQLGGTNMTVYQWIVE
ncbi:MAG TPA: hypothetical protein PLV24_03290 [Anaerolineaceae bacterium]|nr:hypothetical protein [Anaerolineaceae bacterium]